MTRRGPVWTVIGGGGRFMLGAVSAFLVTPYALRVLGTERFGVWALAGGLVALLRLLDLGAGRAVSRELAIARAHGDPAAGADLVAAARGLALVLGAAALAVLAVTLPWLAARLTGLGPAGAAEVTRVLAGTAAVALIEGFAAPSQAALEGLGRMDRVNLVDGLVQRLASPWTVVPVLALGHGLEGLVAKNAVMAVAAGLLYQRALRDEAPALAAPRASWNPTLIRRLTAFGRHPQLVNLATAVVDPAAKLALGASAGLGAVGAYELANRVASQLGGAFMAAAAGLFPAAARLGAGEAEGRGRRLLALHDEARRWMARAALPTWAILIVLAPRLCRLWLGSPIAAEVGVAVRWLSLGWLAALLAIPAFLVNQAAGDARRSSLAGLTTAAVSLAGLAIGRRWGLEGVAIGLSAGLASGGLVMLAAFAREHTLPARRVMPDIKLVTAGLAASLVAAIPAPLGWLALLGQAALASFAALGVLRLNGELAPGEVRRLAADLRRRTDPPGEPA